MSNTHRARRIRNRVIYTMVTALLLISMFLLVVHYSYDRARENGYERLHVQTKEVKDDIELQITSDMENLQTMASFAAKLYSNGENMNLILNSFKPIGLIEDVGIFLPDNSFSTKEWHKTVTEINFEEEAKKVPYISGVVSDVIAPENKTIRSAVPVVVQGKTVAILYGTISLESLKQRLMDNVSAEGVQLFVVERGNGTFIVNTVSKDVGNFSRLKSRKFVNDYTYEEFHDNALGGISGYTAFVSQVMKDTTLYMHYAPLSIGDWQIMMAESEDRVFEEARTTGRAMALVFSAIIIIMSIYLVLLFSVERREGRMNMCASGIRKILLGINQQEDGVSEAIKKIAVFSFARSAFFVSTEDDDFSYMTPAAEKIMLNGDDKSYFISRVINTSKQAIEKSSVTVKVIRLSTDKNLYLKDRQLFEFFRKFKIKDVVLIGVSNKKNHISVLGCVNPKRVESALLLMEDVAVCFSMAIRNKKYLNKTETVAMTDSLTGLYNRLAYKKALHNFDEKRSKDFSCIYIDVNELHVINNKYGHATGDGMLIFISDALKDIFAESRIFRIGGDEFLVFNENMPKSEVEKRIKLLNERLDKMNYHISVGMDFRNVNTDTEETVLIAEKRMYEEKARYYQKKEGKVVRTTRDHGVDRITTGIREFDALLSVMSTRYHGVYCVSLDTGMARRILMPAYLSKFSEEKDSFKDAFLYYVNEMVHSDHQRALTSFLNYDVIRMQLAEGIIPSISYTKVNGEKVLLSVYGIKESNDQTSETLWIFENID